MSWDTYWITTKLDTGGNSYRNEISYIPFSNEVQKCTGISSRPRTQVVQFNTDLPDKVSSWVHKVEPTVHRVEIKICLSSSDSSALPYKAPPVVPPVPKHQVRTTYVVTGYVIRNGRFIARVEVTKDTDDSTSTYSLYLDDRDDDDEYFPPPCGYDY